MSQYNDGTSGDDDDLCINLDLSEKKEEKDLLRSQVPGGFYHVVVRAVQKKLMADKQAINFQFRVVLGPSPETKGKQIFAPLFLTEENDNKNGLWAIRFGLAKLGQKDARPNFGLTRGRHMIVKIEESTYKNPKTGKDEPTTRIAFDGIWPVWHPAVQKVICDNDALECDQESRTPPPDAKDYCTWWNDPNPKLATDTADSKTATPVAGQEHAAPAGQPSAPAPRKLMFPEI